jgi:predicted RNA polymerase sigma factor
MPRCRGWLIWTRSRRCTARSGADFWRCSSLPFGVSTSQRTAWPTHSKRRHGDGQLTVYRATRPAGCSRPRRRVLDRLRAEAVAARAVPGLTVEAELTMQARQVLANGARGAAGVVDERLRLVLLCAHPVLAPQPAAALTLRLVLGVATNDIARLFQVSVPTMAARLTRARKPLAGEAFAVPTGVALVERLDAVAGIAYLAFTAAYAPSSGADVLRTSQADEAVRLVRVVRDTAESVGPASARGGFDALLALVLLQHSRRDARVSDGELVQLPEQDRSLWHGCEIAEALRLLTPLIRSGGAGPYLLQALIAAQHAVAPSAADTDWLRIASLYADLERLDGSPVVRLNRAVAVAEAVGPETALHLLERLDLPGHRLPSVRVKLLARAGRTAEAVDSYDAALELCDNAAEARHLQAERDRHHYGR